jgi:hypothetical protein
MNRNENIVYSVRIKGLDTKHYDMLFFDNYILLRYLGEYWERSRPRAGLQRRIDLHIYRLRKRKVRETQHTSNDDITIEYGMVRSFKLVPPRKRKIWRRIGGRKILQIETSEPMLILELVDGKRYVIEFAPRVYELVKTLVKRYLAGRVAGNK